MDMFYGIAIWSIIIIMIACDRVLLEKRIMISSCFVIMLKMCHIMFFWETKDSLIGVRLLFLFCWWMDVANFGIENHSLFSSCSVTVAHELIEVANWVHSQNNNEMKYYYLRSPAFQMRTSSSWSDDPTSCFQRTNWYEVLVQRRAWVK